MYYLEGRSVSTDIHYKKRVQILNISVNKNLIQCAFRSMRKSYMICYIMKETVVKNKLYIIYISD